MESFRVHSSKTFSSPASLHKTNQSGPNKLLIRMPRSDPRPVTRTVATMHGKMSHGSAAPPEHEEEEEDSKIEELVEELESLEEEAIAGKDEGREPLDYDRRAHIFDESSRVFQELKERNGRDSFTAGSGSEE
ncbi:uncharacterized protein A4U43_C07F6790 [Asparagus officinalis]|uniref:Uncharacterized protein n=1 Tax=Asparagus officinalis TaxID=4686 RepID=A0A5P1EA18_ASPOF|nr:uncharacterized protein A4U43_C07F6790 [Asparagus officinalis]